MKLAVWAVRLAVCVCALSVIFACAKPPTQEIADAEKAIADAKNKEADLYVEDVFAKAQDQMKKAAEMVAAKKYSEAKTAAIEAAKMAGQAASLSDQNKQNMKAELEAMLPVVQKALEEVKGLATTAIRKKAVASKDELQSAIGKLELDMTAVREQLGEGKIRQAYDLLKSLSEQADSQKQILTEAIGK